MGNSPELDVVLSLLFGEPMKKRVGSIDTRDLVALVKRNRVPLASLPETQILADFQEDEGIRRFLEDERVDRENQITAFGEVSSAWDRAGISSVLIKSPGTFPYTGSNVDVLVPRLDAGKASRVLDELGYLELRESREPYKRFYRRIVEPHLGFPIHLHTSVAWISRFLNDGEVLATARPAVDGALKFHVPSPEHVALITTAHWLYEDKELKLRDLYHLSKALEDGVDWPAVEAAADEYGWRDGYAFAIEYYRAAAGALGINTLLGGLPATSGTLPIFLMRELHRVTSSSSPFELSKYACKAMHVKKTFQDHHLELGRKVTEVTDVIGYTLLVQSRKIRSGKAFIVSLSGPDGSGKTTLARGLQTELAGRFGTPAYSQWVRPGSSNTLEMLRGLGAIVMRSQGRRLQPSRRKEALKDRKSLQRLWASVVTADYVLRAWARTLRARAAGGIHIFDRYTIDAVADITGDYNICLPKWARLLMPQADLEVLLVTDPSHASARSSTPASTSMLRAAHDVYKEAERRADLRLDASRPANELLVTLISAILHRRDTGG